jgi:superfamily II DNA or RNA helicase
MTTEVFKKLNTLLEKHSSILECVTEVELLKNSIESETLLESFVNHVRGIVQSEATLAVVSNGGKGLVAMATGSGKSKVAIDLAKIYCGNSTVGIIVPTEKLRDEGWREEFEKWKAQDIWRRVESLCYASGSKIKNKTLGLTILDEAHNITELGSEFFANNKTGPVVALTATVPTDRVKLDLLNNLGLKVVYEVTLDQAVRLGFVAPYQITVVSVPLNGIDKNQKGGSKDKPFMTTEQKTYEYLTKRVLTSPSGTKAYQFAVLRRMQFLYGVQSKVDAAKALLEHVVPKEDRTLIFCGNIKAAEEIWPHTYHSKSGSSYFNAFKKEEIDRLSCVQALNEGQNIPNVDSALIHQLNSKEKNLIQRIGRIIRFRPGHQAHIWILVSEGTQDTVWLDNATQNLDKRKIRQIKLNDLLSGNLTFQDLPQYKEQSLDMFLNAGVKEIQVGSKTYKL